MVSFREKKMEFLGFFIFPFSLIFNRFHQPNDNYNKQEFSNF